MSIGLTFPVKDTDKTIPWGLVEAYRADVHKKHGHTLEYLAAHGGLSHDDLADVLGDAVAKIWLSGGKE